MATRHPRLQVVLEEPLYQAVRQLAEEEGVSLSLKARDLIRDSLMHLEDAALADIVEQRSRKPARLVKLSTLRKRLEK